MFKRYGVDLHTQLEEEKSWGVIVDSNRYEHNFNQMV